MTVDKVIDENKALQTALQDRKLTQENLKDKKIPKGELVFTSIDGNFLKQSYRLAYTFELQSENSTDDYRLYIDAVSGEIIKRHPLTNHCFSVNHTEHPHNLTDSRKTKSLPNIGLAPMTTATFNNLYPRGNPTPTFEVEPFNNEFQLSMSTSVPNTGVQQALQTRWDQNSNFAWDDPVITNSTLNWGNNWQNATLPHWVAWRSYQYFYNRFGVHGTNGSGDIARILISPQFNGAGWSQSARQMIIGRNPDNGTILSTVDIVAHEYGHGVSNYLVGIQGWYPSGVGENQSLNEGFSDIIGAVMERELVQDGGGNPGTANS